MSATNEHQDRKPDKSAPLDSENNTDEQSLTKASDIANGELRVSPPVPDPCQIYDRDARVLGIDCHNFKLSPDGLTPEQRQIALNQLYEYESRQQRYFLGYQTNQKLDFAADLQQYLNFHLNNVGDPFKSGNLTLNTKFMERAVLDYYASLWNARWPHNPQEDPESYWGYVLTMGSTEGNLYGMWNGRDYLAGKFLLDDPDAEAEAKKASEDGRPRSIPRRLIYQQARATEENPNAYTPVAFFSEDTHYSLTKATRTLEVKTFYELGTELYPNDCPIAEPDGTWPKEVPSSNRNEGPGSIDIEALAVLVEFFASKGYPILVCFNYGTTFKGAYDDVEAAGKALMPIFEKYGLYEREVYYDPAHPDKHDTRNGFWFHVDGALGAAYMPFVEMAYKRQQIKQRGPNFDFRLPFVNSISMSGHKWIGAPWPCGIYITKTKFQLRPPDDPEYLGSPDTTFAGSRNGFSAMIFWDYLAKNSYEAQIEKALYTEELAQYAYQQLVNLEQRLGKDLWVEYTPLSLTIRLRQPNDEIVFKYSLSCEELYVSREKRKYCHIYMMAHVTPELIGELIADLGQPDAFPEQNLGISEPQTEIFAANNAMKKLIHVPHNGRGFK